MARLRSIIRIPRAHRASAVVIALVVIVIAAWAIFWRHPSSGIIPSSPPSALSAGAAKLGSSTHSTSSSPTPSSAKTGVAASAPASSSTSSGSLLAPYGNFVSSHHPDASASEYSVCDTSPGAVCYIEFTKDGVTKTLQSQTADNTGSTAWTWNIGSAGLDAGNWTITAIATLSGQTKTTTDAQSLVVQ